MPFSFPFHSFAVSRLDDDAQSIGSINVNWVKKVVNEGWYLKLISLHSKNEFIGRQKLGTILQNIKCIKNRDIKNQ